jgi:hypothetical protein
MAKLHEILAVETGLLGTAEKTNTETIKTFNKKDEHFVETHRAVTHLDEKTEKHLNTEETKAMVTTVIAKLGYNAGANIRAIDAFYQKGATNQAAVADLEVDGKVLAAGVPATVLLGLEQKFTKLRAVYDAIPTLAPGPVWMPAADRGPGVFRSEHPTKTFRTKKTLRPVEMSPATKEHPAQVQAVAEDVPVAEIIIQEWSGMMTSADKSILLGRLDTLIRAAKQARQRANNTEVKKVQMGRQLFDYLHANIVPDYTVGA